MKNLIKYILQKIFGFQTYLYIFSLFMIKKLPRDRKEGAFLHFLEFIKDPQNIIDIGANIGVMTYYFAKKFPGATIHSFEPIPVNGNNILRIVHKFKLNNVHLYNYALGNENGTIEMIMPKRTGVLFHGLSHVVKGKSIEKGITLNAEIKRLDDLNRFLQIPVSAIKLDVENYEYEVLLGAEKIIDKNRPLVYCELWPGENRQKCFELMLKNKYSIFIWSKKKLALFDERAHQQNFFFIPDEQLENLKLKQ